MGMIGELIGTIAQFVPTWLLAIGVAVTAMLLGPGILTGIRVKKVKALLRRTTRSESNEEREGYIAEALERASGRGDVLVALAREADKMNLPVLRDQALEQLKRLGTHPLEVKKLTGPTDPTQDRRFGHPVEAAVSIERLLENGATEAARERLAEALDRFPTDESLQQLASRLEGGPSEGM